MKLNIAIIIPSLRTGGAERAASEIGNHFCDQGHSVYYFLFSNSGKIHFDIKGKVIKTHIPYLLNQKGIKENIRELLFSARSLRMIKKQYKIDASISFMEWANLLNVCSRSIREKVIISVRTVLSERKECEGVFIYNRTLLRILYRYSDKLVAVSNGVKEDLTEKYGISKNIISTIPNASSRRLVNINKDISEKWIYGSKAVICVGRLDPVKQFDCAIRAFSVASQTDVDARLIVVGNGRQMSHLVELIKRFGLEGKVFLVGTKRNVEFYFSNAACFLMTSKVEGFPNAMVEAMAYDIPIISSDSPGGCGEIIGKKHTTKGIEYCDFGVMTPQIKRDNLEDDDISDEERILGKAIFEMINNIDLRTRYSTQSAIRSRYYAKDNVMHMWDSLLRE